MIKKIVRTTLSAGILAFAAAVPCLASDFNQIVSSNNQVLTKIEDFRLKLGLEFLDEIIALKNHLSGQIITNEHFASEDSEFSAEEKAILLRKLEQLNNDDRLMTKLMNFSIRKVREYQAKL